MEIKKIYGGKYEVSDTGRLFSNARSKRKELVGGLDQDGYRLLSLHVNGKKITKKLHRLVAIAFIPNPKNLPAINHKDGIKLNNNISNLEWYTNKENSIHAANYGLSGCAKINMKQANEIRELYATGNYFQREIGVMFGLAANTISNIVNNKKWVVNENTKKYLTN